MQASIAELEGKGKGPENDGELHDDMSRKSPKFATGAVNPPPRPATALRIHQLITRAGSRLADVQGRRRDAVGRVLCCFGASGGSDGYGVIAAL